MKITLWQQNDHASLLLSSEPRPIPARSARGNRRVLRAAHRRVYNRETVIAMGRVPKEIT
jgi:hypothetical protein